MARWKEEGTFQRSLELREGRPRFVFYEGPPTANGKPATHHILARAFKDLFGRYKTMQGFYVERAVQGSTSFAQVGQVGANATSATDQAGTGRWTYRVRAFNATRGRLSAYSNQVSVRLK